MRVIGTAGHVDHGKSALVRALTGIDPDRLKEEKEREMTIDLGFAWLKLPSGRDVRQNQKTGASRRLELPAGRSVPGDHLDRGQSHRPSESLPCRKVLPRDTA